MSLASLISVVNAMAAVTMMAMMTTDTPSKRPMRSISRCSGVRCSLVSSSRRATVPISVAMPVAVTMAVPRPRLTAVPLNTMFTRSPMQAAPSIASMPLSTASLSPVSDASATVSDATSVSLASALTASPSPSRSTSPTTTSVVATCFSTPSRITRAFGAAICWSAATACSALASCTKPSAAFRITMVTMTITSKGTPWRPSSSQAMSEMTTAASNR